MSKTINNIPLAAKAGMEGSLGGNGTRRTALRISDRQAGRGIQQLNDKVVLNPNRRAGRTTAGNQTTGQGNVAKTRTRTGNPQGNPRAETQSLKGNQRNGEQVRSNQGNQGNQVKGHQTQTGKGTENASEQGLRNGQGLQKGRQTAPNPNTPTTTDTNTQTNQNPTWNQGNTTGQNQGNTTTGNNIPPITPRNQTNIGNETTTAGQIVQTGQPDTRTRAQTLRTNGQQNEQNQTQADNRTTQGNQTNDVQIPRTNADNIPLEQQDNRGQSNRDNNYGSLMRRTHGHGNSHRGKDNGWHGNSRGQTQTGQGNQTTFPPRVNPPNINNQQLPDDGNQIPNQNTNQNSVGQNNRETNYVRQIFRQVLRENNVHLNGNVINRIFRELPTQSNAGNPITVPHEVQNLIANIRDQISVYTNNSPHLNGRDIRFATNEILIRLTSEIETARPIFFQDRDFGAKLFKQLNMPERMQILIEMLPSHLPSDVADILQNFTSKQIQDGMLLPLGFVAGRENSADLRALISFQPPILPREITVTNLRDLGQYIKVLVADAGVAKTSANADLAVQKFIRLMLANNELGVLLATINLASQTYDTGSLTSRTIELVKIYELIMRFIQAGEKKMNEAMPQNISKLDKDDSIKQIGLKSLETDDVTPQNSKTLTGAESSLRQFLEFNPNAAFDNSASAFTSSDDARQAQKDFVAHHYDEIESWLQSGKHRFVKDFDFEKPIGVVVEREADGFFSANKMRVILVRDGSVQGWHFLKSVLVR